MLPLLVVAVVVVVVPAVAVAVFGSGVDGLTLCLVWTHV